MNTAADYITSRFSEAQPAINLLNIGLPSEKVEGYARIIRSLGRAVHSAYIHSMDALEQHLAESDTQIILVDLDRGVDLEALLNAKHASECDAAIIAFGPLDKASHQAEITDFIENEVRAPQVIVREHDNLMMRRQLQDAERRLQETEHRCDGLMKSSKEAIAYVHQGMHVSANAVYLEMFKVEDEESLDGYPLMDLVNKEFRNDLKRILNTIDFGMQPRFFEARCQTISGDDFPATFEFTAATIDGELCAQIIIRREVVSEELEHLKRLADRDPQTGLFNRSYFLSAVRDAIPNLYADTDRQYVLMFLAVDDFAEIRDRHGFDTAEEFIKETAEVIAGKIDDEALLARFGDSTFSILSRIGSESQAKDLAEVLRVGASTHAYASLKHFTTPSLSVGMLLTRHCRVSNEQEFINLANKALQAAVAAGGDRAVEYSPEKHKTERSSGPSVSDSTLEALAFAQSHNRFLVRYHPVVPTIGNPMEHYLVELRIRDVDDKEHSAVDQLISAQRAGKFLEIDRWLLQTSLRTLTTPAAENRQIGIQIPLFPAAFADEKFPSWLHTELRSRRISPNQITFLIDTEDTKLKLEKSRALSSALASLGCGVLLDRFGVTAEDTTLLKHLPAVSGIRFDPKLTEALQSDPRRVAMLHDVVSQLHAASKTAVIVGINHASALAQAWGLGVDFIQGSFFSVPLEAPVFDFSQY